MLPQPGKNAVLIPSAILFGYSIFMVQKPSYMTKTKLRSFMLMLSILLTALVSCGPAAPNLAPGTISTSSITPFQTPTVPTTQTMIATVSPVAFPTSHATYRATFRIGASWAGE